MPEMTSAHNVREVLNHPVLRHFVVIHGLFVGGMVVAAMGFGILAAHLWPPALAYAAVAFLAACALAGAGLVTPWLPELVRRSGVVYVLGWAIGLLMAVSICLMVAPNAFTVFSMAPAWGVLYAVRRVTFELSETSRMIRDSKTAIEHTNRGVAAAVCGLAMVLLLAVAAFFAAGNDDGAASTMRVVQFAGVVGVVVSIACVVSLVVLKNRVELGLVTLNSHSRVYRPWWRTRAFLAVRVMKRRAGVQSLLLGVALAAVVAGGLTVLPIVAVSEAGATGLISQVLIAATGVVVGAWLATLADTDNPQLSYGIGVAGAAACGFGAIVIPSFPGMTLLVGCMGILVGFAMSMGSTLAGSKFAQEAQQRSYEVLSIAVPTVAAVAASVWMAKPVYAALCVFAVIGVLAIAAAVAQVWLTGDTKERLARTFKERVDKSMTARRVTPGGAASSGSSATPAESAKAQVTDTEPAVIRDTEPTPQSAPVVPVAADKEFAPARPEPIAAIPYTSGPARRDEAPITASHDQVPAVSAEDAAQSSLGALHRDAAHRSGRGRFLAVEGGDGVGKSTIVSALATALGERTDQRIVVTREPGGTSAGRRLRDLLLGNIAWVSKAEALMFAADRAQHVQTVIQPALDAEAIVISDRYVDSSIAYQSGGRELSKTDVAMLSQWATSGLSPDLTVVLDLDPDIAAERRQADDSREEDDRLEKEDHEFHRKVREGFLQLAGAHPDRYVVVDASRPRPVVVEQVIDQVLNRMGWNTDSFTATGEVPVVDEDTVVVSRFADGTGGAGKGGDDAPAGAAKAAGAMGAALAPAAALTAAAGSLDEAEVVDLDDDGLADDEWSDEPDVVGAVVEPVAVPQEVVAADDEVAAHTPFPAARNMPEGVEETEEYWAQTEQLVTRRDIEAAQAAEAMAAQTAQEQDIAALADDAEAARAAVAESQVAEPVEQPAFDGHEVAEDAEYEEVDYTADVVTHQPGDIFGQADDDDVAEDDDAEDVDSEYDLVDSAEADVSHTLRPDAASVAAWARMVPSVVPASVRPADDESAEHDDEAEDEVDAEAEYDGDDYDDAADYDDEAAYEDAVYDDPTLAASANPITEPIIEAEPTDTGSHGFADTEDDDYADVAHNLDADVAYEPDLADAPDRTARAGHVAATQGTVPVDASPAPATGDPGAPDADHPFPAAHQPQEWDQPALPNTETWDEPAAEDIVDVRTDPETDTAVPVAQKNTDGYEDWFYEGEYSDDQNHR